MCHSIAGIRLRMMRILHLHIPRRMILKMHLFPAIRTIRRTRRNTLHNTIAAPRRHVLRRIRRIVLVRRAIVRYAPPALPAPQVLQALRAPRVLVGVLRPVS